ncbi:MAG: acyl-CoA desaturase [Bacteroidota bacterium]
MTILIAFIAHWFLSLFMHSFFLHRYAAHQMFKMSKFWEKTFFVLMWITQNSSFLSPRAYAILHRMHHAYSDTEKDPHTPSMYPNPLVMIWKTRQTFVDIQDENIEIEDKFRGGYPTWGKVEAFMESSVSRIGWGLIFIAFYVVFATAWWQFLLLPLHWFMSPLHGLIVNWFGHKTGYTNFDNNDDSKNTMPVDIFMLGELFQNNHHYRPLNPNFGARWYEIDPVYVVMKPMSWLGIIKFTRSKEQRKQHITAEEFASRTLEFLHQVEDKVAPKKKPAMG